MKSRLLASIAILIAFAAPSLFGQEQHKDPEMLAVLYTLSSGNIMDEYIIFTEGIRLDSLENAPANAEGDGLWLCLAMVTQIDEAMDEADLVDYTIVEPHKGILAENTWMPRTEFESLMWQNGCRL